MKRGDKTIESLCLNRAWEKDYSSWTNEVQLMSSTRERY